MDRWEEFKLDWKNFMAMERVKMYSDADRRGRIPEWKQDDVPTIAEALEVRYAQPV